MKRICVVTGSRAEYGLLYGLIKGIHEDPDLTLQLLVTGMHLAPEFGSTWQLIEADGFPITRKIDLHLTTDTALGVAQTMAEALTSFTQAFESLKPEVVVLLGDRTEIFSVAQAALLSGIPIAHLHGGELTEGAYDDAIRHSLTKMSHLHFTATEAYRQRVIQLGEQPTTVYNVGAIGLDNIKQFNLLNREKLEAALGHPLMRHNLLITFHPVTLEQQTAEHQFDHLLTVLDEQEDTLLIFTKPNSDRDGRVISQQIDHYVATHPEKAIAFTSLGPLRYLSTIPYMDAVVGNSSSALIEVPAFKVPTVNVGDRQKGRLRGPSIFDCEPTPESIRQALRQALAFDRTSPYEQPYGDGHTAARILTILKQTNRLSLKKHFFDITP